MTQSFIDLGVSEAIQSALIKRGITAPFAVQTKVLPDAIAGRDILCKSRTGSGKTLGFAIPIVERLDANCARPSALVLTPTRELAQQVAAELTGFAGTKGLKVALAYGGTSVGQQGHQARKAHIIVATPGRLEDLVTRRFIALDQIKILVLDEADHMLDMGFLPQVDRLVERIPADRQTMLFSATLDGEVGRVAKRYTRDPITHELSSPKPATADVEHRFVPVDQMAKTEALAELLQSQDSTLVFVRTKHGADRLVKKLALQGIGAASMHGDKSQNARDEALSRFTRGKVAALVATDVAARGIDVRNVARVVNYDAPGDDKAFVHRVGRTGRAGARGISITFVSPDQQREIGQMADRLKLTKEFTSAGFIAAPARSGRPNRSGAPSRGRRPSGGARTRSRRLA